MNTNEIRTAKHSVVSERVKRSLQELGLTEYETRAYVALVEAGTMTASEISEAADVPYSKVYEILGELEEKGFIESQGGRPAKYVPKAPATALESVRLRLEKKLKEHEEIVLNELMSLYEKRGSRERPDIWILRGESSIFNKVKELAAKCENELLVAAPFLPKSLETIIHPFAASARARGCNVLIMTSNTVDQSAIRRLAEVGEVRVRGTMYGGGVVRDTQEVVIVFAEEGGTGPLGIWSDHIGLARFAKNYFGYLWAEAAPFKRR